MDVKALAMVAQAAGAHREDPQENPQLRAVARQFESLLVNRMVKTMRQTVQDEGVFPKGHAEKVYESMLDQQYAEQISESGQMGLGDMIYRQLLRNFGSQ